MTERLAKYPTNHVVAIAADAATVDACREAVTAADADIGELTVLDPEQAADATLDPSTDDTLGPLERLRKVFGDETPHLEALAAALREGAFVVMVELREPDAVTDADHTADKQAVGEALRTAGATDITYYGRWTVEQVGHRA